MINDLVSIIIPVYNSEKYLDACLQSVLAQTYRNIEILLIDDGSTDRSGVICDAYAVKDTRIHVFHNQNHGVSYSRNCGIKFSKGSFLTFIDSDDSVSETYIEGMISAASKHDLVISEIIDTFTYEGGEKIKREINGLIGNKFTQNVYVLRAYLRLICAKLYRAEIIRKHEIYFDENISYKEDQIFNYRYYLYIQSFVHVNEGCYYYFHRKNNSLNQKGFCSNDFESTKKVTEKLIQWIKTINSRQGDLFLWDTLFQSLGNTYGGYEKYSQLCEFVRKTVGMRYVAANPKRWLVLKCIQYGWYKIIYIYYRLKWIRQQGRN